MGKLLRILQVEDSEDDALLILRALKKEGYDIRSERVETADSLAAALAGRDWDIVLSDYAMSGFNGMDALKIVLEKNRDLPVIIISGALELERAVALLRAGADDFITKDNLVLLPRAVERVLAEKQTRRRQVQAEEALRQSEEQMKSILDANPNPVVVYDAKGLPQYLNPAFTLVFGWTLDELKGKPIPFVPEDQQQVTSDKIAELYRDGIPVRLQTRRMTKQGRPIETIVSASIIKDRESRPLGTVVNLTDITEQRKLEARLRQSQKMESIGNLAGGIAHDFNNILFPIIGMAELLCEDLPRDSLEAANAMEILKAGKRGRELVKQILAFSRKTEQRRIPVQVRNIIQDVLKLGRSTIPSNIAIHSRITANCGLVMADPTQIHQICINLITNASHAVDALNGEISVELQEKALSAPDVANLNLSPGRYALIRVRDNGCGIPLSIIHKIFDPYFTTKEQGKGTGLGLAVVYGIVRKHGGDIQVYSEPGQGAAFNVYLPLMERTETPGTGDPDAGAKQGSEHILLVDDEDAIARLEEQILMRLGYRVTAFTESRQALEAFKANPDGFDLVITDMTMPGRTGDQLAREMMGLRPDLPVIICSGFSERINEERAKRLGIQGYLVKPVVKSELARMVRQVLDDAGNGA